MTTLYVDNIAPNLQSKISAPNLTLPAGSIIQCKHRNNINNNFSTSSTSFIDVTGFYVDITPISATNLLVFQASLWHRPTGNSGGYSRWRIVDSNNSDAVWNELSYVGSAGYLGTKWENIPIMHTTTAGTTNAMSLQLQVRVTGGGTMDMNWSSSENKTIQVMEIAG